ncbi:Dynamin-3 [Taenia solium]|eukprot:TsM_000804000 transcript=TsM_000804000 gene=TsM_000804000
MRLCFVVLLLILVAGVCVNSRGNRPKVRAPSRKYKTSFSNLKSSSGLSLNKKLLLAAGSMAAVYVGFKLASNRDISRYTICEGRRVELDSFGVPREYLYTVCPSHLRYCCRSELYDGERCCAGRSYYSYSQPRGTIIGSLFGTLLMILGIGLLVYFCCLRRRRKQSPSVADEVFSVPSSPPPPPPNFVTVGGYTPALDPGEPTYPVSISKSGPYPDQPPPYPASVPSGIQPPPYPGLAPPAQNPPYPAPTKAALGSGWGAAPQPPPPPSPPYPPP